MNPKQLKEQQIKKANVEDDSLTSCLMEQICKPANLNQAYKRVKANKGSPGVDGMRVDDMREFIAKHKESLVQSLLEGCYKPQPVRKVEIPKPDGTKRQLGIPTVMDRLIQQAILQVLQPIYEREFSDSSYGFRPKRSAHQAVKRAQEYVRSGNRIVVDIDLEKFFDRVNHDILMSRIARRIKDKRLLKIIRCFLEAGIMEGGVCIERHEGTPQGGPLSPLLSNILLDELDKELEKRGHKFCRYADDCNVYVKSIKAGARVLSSVKEFLGKRLRLKINEVKSAVSEVWKRQFLGFKIQHNEKIGLSEQSEKKLKDTVRQLTKRNRGIKLKQVIESLNQKFHGWINYFKIVETPSKLRDLDSWTRRKLRCYRLKQRKRCYSIVKFLITLGVSSKNAWRIGKSSKGWWRLSHTGAVNNAMSNDWFEKLGLISLEKKASLLSA
jgi:RNA-directed DNA polymerase